MPRLKHNQAEPLAIIPLQQERVDYFYKLLEKDKKRLMTIHPSIDKRLRISCSARIQLVSRLETGLGYVH